jgi:hypothetical protein
MDGWNGSWSQDLVFVLVWETVHSANLLLSLKSFVFVNVGGQDKASFGYSCG